MMFERRGAYAAVLGALLVAAPMQRAAAGSGRGGAVGVMTMNMYVGTDTNSLLNAQTQQGLALAVTTAYQNILKTNPAERIAVMAREIARRDPALVGLQEVALLRTGPSTSPATPATHVEIDFLEMLLDDLAKLGRHYNTAAIVPGLDAQAASLLGKDIRLTGRTAIIARTGIRLANLQVEDFLTNLRVSIPISPGSITDTRGWIAVDADLGGRALRFVTTHLADMPTSQLAHIQSAQAAELLAGAANTPLPVIMAADFNADADNPAAASFATYATLLEAGFADAWAQFRPGDPGFTCCQAPDLRNPVSELGERSDLVLYRGPLQPEDASLAGNRTGERASSGLWPSDHAAVAASFGLAGSTQTAQH